MEKVCVYLGAQCGNPEFVKYINQLAHEIRAREMTLVYGGSSLGMMGLLATTVKNLGGKVIGVTTKFLLDKEKPLDILDSLHIVNSMQERKKMLQSISDIFVVMPGGLGTLEEAIETLNAIKIGELEKSIGFLNVNSYFSKLFEFFDDCQKTGFINKNQIDNHIVCDNPGLLIEALLNRCLKKGR